MTTTRNIRGEGGFTLLEVTVVLGLLASFVLFLTQILASSVELLDEGETGQELADLGHAAGDATVAAMEDMVGPRWVRFERAQPDARLVVQWVPLGLSKFPTATRVQVMRASVRLTPTAETALLKEKLLLKHLQKLQKLKLHLLLKVLRLFKQLQLQQTLKKLVKHLIQENSILH